MASPSRVDPSRVDTVAVDTRADGAFPCDAASALVDHAIAEFFIARKPRKDSPHTTAAYQRDLDAVRCICAEQLGVEAAELRLDQLTVAALRVSFATFAETHAKTSISRAWSTWNQFLAFCVSDGRLGGNPMSGVAKPRLPRRAPKPLRGEDTPERLLTAVANRTEGRDPWPERDLAIVATLLLTGIRSAELLGLTTASLVGGPGERRLHVLGKGGKSRSVPVERPLEAVLSAYLDSRARRFPGARMPAGAALFVDRRGEPLQRGGLQYLVRNNLRWAGLGDRRSTGALVHALRHTYATRLAEDGASASEIMALLGHVSITTSQAYIDATAREQRAAAGANRTYRVVRDLMLPAPAAE